MFVRAFALGAVLAFVGACKSSTSSPATDGAVRLAVVSGSNQMANVSTALAAPLVVQAVTAAGRPVTGVSVTWTVTGGGSVTPAASTTDASGQASVSWTLGPRPGVQTATASSPAISGANASFIASNGATITGAVTIANPNPTTFFSASRARQAAAAGTHAATVPRYSSHGLVVIFRSDLLHVAAAGSPAYRSIATARSTAAMLRDRIATLTSSLPVRAVRVSPAILAAHVTLSDTTAAATVTAALRADPTVVSVSPDVIVSIRDGAPVPQAVALRYSGALRTSSRHATGAATSVPNDPYYWTQAWNSNMIDLPRAWAITTGSTGFTIAVIDMGVRFDDPDVAANFTQDGYDFVSATPLTDLGYASPGNFCNGGSFTTIDDDSTPGPDPDPTDPNDVAYDSTQACWQPQSLGDHGLWTSGIIGAVGNDQVGAVGVNWVARIRPIRVLGITGDGTGFDVAQGILYAAGLAATGENDSLVTAPSRSPIINLSLGGFGSDPSEQAAVAAAEQAGSLIVAAAGNATTDIPFYPAAYPGVIAVSAVGMDGVIASYSNGGSYVSLAAPGGEFRLDDNGGDGVFGPGWDFTTGAPTYLFGYGTSAAAPHVAGVAALLLAHEPGLTASQLTTRLEQYANRPPNSTRSDNYGWGIVDAFNALTQQNGPPRALYARLLDATTGVVVASMPTDAGGGFAFTQLATGSYELEAGQDESADGRIGIPGRRFAWAGGAAGPTPFSTSGPAVQTAGVAIGVPMEAEPNDNPSTATPLSVDAYVEGYITPPDSVDYYKVLIPTTGVYTFETSGVTGACGAGIELDTYLELHTSSGALTVANDDDGLDTGPACSSVSASLAPGTYYVVVRPNPNAGALNSAGRYRLEARSGS